MNLFKWSYSQFLFFWNIVSNPLKHEIQLSKVLLSLKVVKFDKKMYLNFSNFWGRTYAGGQALVQKWGQVSDGGGGGLAKFLLDGGTPSPPRKKPWASLLVLGLNVLPFVMHFALVVCNVWIKVDITIKFCVSLSIKHMKPFDNNIIYIKK